MLLAKLCFELLDALGLLTFRILVLGKGGCAVLKELLLPLIKNCWLQLVLVAYI